MLTRRSLLHESVSTVYKSEGTDCESVLTDYEFVGTDSKTEGTVYKI